MGNWLNAFVYAMHGLYFALCLYTVFVIFRLARYKRGAPKLLLIAFLTQAILLIIDLILTFWAQDVPKAYVPSSILTIEPVFHYRILWPLIWLALHWVYYRKRAPLFCR